MSTKDLGLLIKSYRESCSMKSDTLAKNIKPVLRGKKERKELTSARISQIEKGELKNLEYLLNYIEQFAEIFSRNLNEGKEAIREKLLEALNKEKDRNLTKEEIIKRLSEIIDYCGNYDNLKSFIKDNLPEYFQNKTIRENLKPFLGYYKFYQFARPTDKTIGKEVPPIIIQRYMYIYEKDKNKIRVDRYGTKPYKYENGIIRKIDNLIIIDIKEKRQKEEIRIALIDSVIDPDLLTGISSELTANGEPMAKYIILQRVPEPSKEEIEKANLFTEEEFKKIEPEMYEFLSAINSKMLIARSMNYYYDVYKRIFQ